MPDGWGRDVLGYAPASQFNRVKREQIQKTGKFVQMAKKWLLTASRKGSIVVTGWKCFCGGNHFALRIGDNSVCPIRFILAMTVLAESEETAQEFLSRHKPSEILRPANPGKDASYNPKLHPEGG